MYFCHRWTSFSKTFLPMQTKWLMILPSYAEKMAAKEGRPLVFPLWYLWGREVDQRPAFFGGHFSQHKRQGHWSFGLHRQKVFEKEEFIWDKNTFFPVSGKMYFLSQMNLLLKAFFSRCKTKWPMTLSLMLRKMAAKEGRPFGFSSLLIFFRRKRGRPKVRPLGGHFLNDKRQGHMVIWFAEAVSFEKGRFSCDKKIHSFPYRAEWYYVTDEIPLFSKTFSAYAKPND